MSNLTVAHLFDGIGGFHVASDRAGMETLWVSEIDRHASAVTDHHWPHIKNLGDIHGIESPPAVDVLTGGFPCQDYSVAGTRGGLAGDNGALWWEYLRLIAECRPSWVVGENVPGLLSSRGGADFETIVGSLTECGYGVAWAVLDAQYFGVAQRRRRVFIVGHSGGVPRPEILALSEGLFGHPEPRRETRERLAGTLETRPPDSRQRVEENHLIAFSAGNSGDSYGIGYSEDHTPPLRSVESGTNQVPTIAATLTQGAPSAGRRNEDDFNLVDFAQNQRDEVRDLDDQAGALAAEPGMKQQTYVMSVRGREGGANLELESELSPALRGGGDSQTGEYSQRIWSGPSVRRLTPLECERLQGFPDGWTDIPGNSDTQRYRQLGNAVAVPVAEWIMRRIADAS